MIKHYLLLTKRGFECWSSIDSIKSFDGETYFLMENDILGDEVNFIIMSSQGKVVEWDWCDTLLEWKEENTPFN